MYLHQPARLNRAGSISEPISRSQREITARFSAPISSAWCPAIRFSSRPQLRHDSHDFAQPSMSGARDTAVSVTSWFARWTTKPLNPSAMIEHD